MTHLFAGVAPATVDAVRSAYRLRSFAPGEAIMDVDQMPFCIYHVLSGRARVWRPGRDGRVLVLYFVGPAEVVGFIPMIRRRPGPATITAVTAVDTECWPLPLLAELLQTDARFATNVLRLVAERFNFIVERLGDLAGGRVDQQLARALLRLAGEEGAWEDTATVTVPVTRQDLADMTGTTLSTASRTLSGWGERGLVSSVRGEVTVLQPHALAELADLEG